MCCGSDCKPPFNTLTTGSGLAGCMLCRNLTLEAACSSALDAQYGRAAAAIIRSRLIEHPARLAINALWDAKVDGKPFRPCTASVACCTTHLLLYEPKPMRLVKGPPVSCRRWRPCAEHLWQSHLAAHVYKKSVICFTGDKVGCCTCASTVDIAPCMVPARTTLLSDLLWCTGVDVSLSTCRWLACAQDPFAGGPLEHDCGVQHVAEHGCSTEVDPGVGQGQAHACKAAVMWLSIIKAMWLAALPCSEALGWTELGGSVVLVLGM